MRGLSLLSTLLILFLVAGVWLLNPRVLALTGGDGWWLACYARAFFETGHIPRQVLGSFALEGYTYHHPAWLYGLWTYLWLSLGGPLLWVWMDVLMVCSLGAFLLFRTLRNEGLDKWTGAVLIGWIGALSWAGQTQRGQIWAIVLFLWLLSGIREALLNEHVPRRVLVQFPLIVFLWAGVQGGFFLPLGLIVLAVLFRPSRSLLAALGLSVLASFLHPYAPQNWVDHLLILRNPPTFIWEWQSLPKVIRNLSAESGESAVFVGAIALLPFLLSLAPLLLPGPRNRWTLFLSLITAGFTFGALRHVRQLVWALNAAAVLWGNRLGNRSWTLPRPVLGVHLLLALLGWGLHLPSLLHAGFTDMEETPAFLSRLRELPPSRVFATLQVANTLCWLNPSLSQWMYGTFQLGIARTQDEWDRITREVVMPFLQLPRGGDEALDFLRNHRVDFVILHRTRDRGLRNTLQDVGCHERERGQTFSVFELRDCLWQTPAGSPPPEAGPAP